MNAPAHRSRTHRFTTLSVGSVALLATLLAACGGGDDGGSATTPAPETPSASATKEPAAVTGSGACEYVSTAEASDLAASPVKDGVNRSLDSGPVTFEYCDYIFDPGNSPGVSVAVADLTGSSSEMFASFRQSKSTESDYQVVRGVGDEAFFAGQNLNVRKGDKGLILYVGRSTGSPRGADALPDEKRLAKLILDRL